MQELTVLFTILFRTKALLRSLRSDLIQGSLCNVQMKQRFWTANRFNRLLLGRRCHWLHLHLCCVQVCRKLPWLLTGHCCLHDMAVEQVMHLFASVGNCLKLWKKHFVPDDRVVRLLPTLCVFNLQDVSRFWMFLFLRSQSTSTSWNISLHWMELLRKKKNRLKSTRKVTLNRWHGRREIPIKSAFFFQSIDGIGAELPSWNSAETHSRWHKCNPYRI